MKKNEKTSKIVKKAFKITIIYLFLVIWLFIIAYPLLFLLQNSLKGNIEFFTSEVWSFPESLNLGNYVSVIVESGFYRYFLNSIYVCVISVIIIIFASSLASYVI